MKSKPSRRSGQNSGRSSGRGPRRPFRSHEESSPQSPAKTSFWQKIVAFFTKKTTSPKTSRPPNSPQGKTRRQPESVEVTSPKLYVGNLSFDAAENDLFELFNGVGAVRNAEIVTHKDTEKSKGFGFVTMSSVDEAKRAVVELHDRKFLGRLLVVSGAKSTERESNYRG